MKKGRGKRYAEEIGSTATLVGAGVAGAHLIPWNFFESLRDSVKLARHSGKTMYDFAVGGPEGMRAAKNLEDVMKFVGENVRTEEEVALFENYMLAERKDLVGELVRVYEYNENFARVAPRLRVQLEGTVKNLFEAGNDLKPSFMEKIDDAIISAFGQKPEEARAKSERLQEYYGEVREFYDSREKNEHTVKEFCNALTKKEEASAAQNRKFNELFPNIIARVRETYKTEDVVFEGGERNILGMRKDVSRSNLDELSSSVEKYDENVDKTYTEVARELPIAPYSPPSWIDYAVNPVALGIAVGLAAKGATKILPGIIERPVRTALAAPVLLSYNLAKYVGGKFRGPKKLNNELSRKKDD